MVSDCVTLGNGVAGRMVWTPAPAILNAMTSPPEPAGQSPTAVSVLAASIAARSVHPTPVAMLSATDVTVMVVALTPVA